jgi:hypothetical protein
MAMANKNKSKNDKKAELKSVDEVEATGAIKNQTDPRPDVGENVVIVRNKVGESDKAAEKRVGAEHPGMKLVDETQVGLTENPNVKGKPADQLPAPSDAIPKKNVSELVNGVPYDKAPPSVLEVTNKPASTLPPPPSSDVVEELAYASPGVQINMSATTITPKFKSAITTLFTLPQYGTRDEIPYMTIDNYSKKIGTFSNAYTFLVTFSNLVREVAEIYNGIYQGFTDETEQLFHRSRVTVSGSIGLDLRKMLPQLRSDLVPLLTDYIQRLGTVKAEDNGRYDRIYDVFVHPNEHRLQERLRANETKLILGWPNTARGVQDLWDFYSNLDNEIQYLKTIDPSIDLNFKYVSYSLTSGNGNSAYDILCDNNVIMRNFGRNVMEQMITKNVEFQVESDATLLTKMLNKLKIRVGQYDDVNSLPVMVSSAKAMEFARQIILASTLNDWVELSYDMYHEKFELSVLVDCLLFKLLTPKQLWSVTMVNKIDNYICKWFIPYIKGYKSERDGYNLLDASAGIRNFLSEGFANNFLDAATMQAIAPFLRTTVDGSGWMGAGQNQTVSMTDIKGGATFMNVRNGGAWYNYYSGVPYDDIKMPVEQFNRFDTFYKYFDGVRNRLAFSRPNTGQDNALFIVLSLVEESQILLSEMVIDFNRKLKLLGLTSLAKVVPSVINNNRTGRIDRMPIKVAPMSAFSMLRLIKWDQIRPQTIERSVIRFGWAVREYFEQFVFWYNYVNDTFPSVRVTRKERINMAFSLAKTDSGVDKMFSNEIVGKPEAITLKVPGTQQVLNAYWNEKINAATEFIRAMAPYFGYSPFFVYDATPRIESNAVFEKIYVPREDAKVYVYTEASLEHDLRINAFAEKVLDVRSQGGQVRFDMPVHTSLFMLTAETYKGGRIPEEYPVTYETAASDQSVATKNVQSFQQMRDEYFNKRANDFAFIRTPEFFTGKLPIIVGGPDILMNLFHNKITSIRNEFTEMTSFSTVVRT